MSTAVASRVKARRSAISIVSASVVRTIVFTVTCTGLGMGLGLFAGILVQVVRSLMHRNAPIDMTVAYRFFAFPLAAICGVSALVVFVVLETRTARRLLAAR
ncbi:hypothetical protein [Candidatus Korobacter versatilis]|nr:hypothetical protein [Candidatus Koribacter versatilis]